MPGARLTEVVDAQTFTGTLKVKVGAVQITYQGTAHIVETEELDDRVIVKIDAKGKEVGGQGTVRAAVAMTVSGSGGSGSEVSIEADLNITGKIAQFGRGIIEDVPANWSARWRSASAPTCRRPQPADWCRRSARRWR